MSTPGGLPARRSIYEAPAIDPATMTDAEKNQLALAQVATIAAAAGASKASIADNTTLFLVPLLRTLDPYNTLSVTSFAAKAAEIIELARQQTAQITWASVISRMNAYGLTMTNDYTQVAPSRTTPLEIAYERPAAAYRLRMDKGLDSIKALIAQAEEERYQQLGGDAAAQERTGESNAEVKAKAGAQSADPSKKSDAGSSGAGASPKTGGTAKPGGQPSSSTVGKPDVVPSREPDDWDPAADVAEEARERELDAAFDAEQELREQARLSEEERQELLAQQAEQDMEIRMERMVNDDLGMASRDAHRDAMTSAPPEVIGYRRVLHPELTKYGKSCGLCVAASTRVYKKSELMPMHNLCKCEAVEVFSFGDPGQQINDDDLAILYDEAGGTTDGRDLKKQRYVVFDHPELGPVLRNEKHSIQPIKFSTREKNQPGEGSNAA